MRIHCPHCNKDVDIADNLAGMQLRCPACRKLIAAPQPAPAVVKPAAGTAPGVGPKPPGPGAPPAQPRPSGPSGHGTAPGTGPKPPPGPNPGGARHAVIAQQQPVAVGKLAMGPMQAMYRPMLDAVGLAARAHKNQLRKDDKTPYVSHVFRVMFIVRHVFNIEDPQVLMTAVLHDTLEDTTTDFDDLKKESGDRVAEFVGYLTKDKRVVEEQRENMYRNILASSAWQVQVCKLADIFDNLLDMGTLTPPQRAKTLQRCREYLHAIGGNVKEQARQAHVTVAQLLAEVEKG